MRPLLAVLCLALVVVAVAPVSAADSPELKLVIRQNMEDGLIFPLGGVGNNDPLLFEARVCPYYALTWGESQSVLVFQFKSYVRMSLESSVPVRTPSYMPRFIYYNYGSDTEGPRPYYYYIMASHHSNGQEGDFFNPDGSINCVNGSFSTNFLEGGVYFYERTSRPGGRWWMKFSGGLALQMHVPIARSKEFKEVGYGFWRLKYWNRWRPRKGTEVSLEPFVIMGSLHEAEDLDWRRLGLDVSLRQEWSLLDGFDLLLNCYVGQDYYNINYTRYLRTVRLGLVTNFDGIGRKSEPSKPERTPRGGP